MRCPFYKPNEEMIGVSCEKYFWVCGQVMSDMSIKDFRVELVHANPKVGVQSIIDVTLAFSEKELEGLRAELIEEFKRTTGSRMDECVVAKRQVEDRMMMEGA
jgi:hypothetical protein